MTVSAIPMAQVRFPYVSNLEIAITGDTTLTVQPGQCRSDDNQFQIVNREIVNVDAAHVSLAGLDTGVLENNTLYGVYLIGDLVTARVSKVIVSKNLEIPVMPFQYNAFRLIGFVRTDGSAHFLPGKFYGHGSERTFVYDTPVATAVTAGAAVAYAAVDLESIVPPQDGLPVLVSYEATPSASGSALSLHSFGGSANGYSAVVTGQVASEDVTGVEEVLAGLNAGAPAVAYKWSGAGNTVALSVSGYRYSL